MMAAPSGTSASYAQPREFPHCPPPGEPADLPPIYEHLARPETQEEYYHGELRLKVPAKPPHAIRHSQLAYLLEAHVAEGYLAAVEMLTRIDPETDFAPDASIFPVSPGENIGEKRQLERLAFEVCCEQDPSVPASKARDLVGRGVKRVFCIVVGGPTQKRRPGLKKSYVAEWSTATDAWSPLPGSDFIEDKCLATPLPVKALLDATESDDAVVHALKARGNRAIREIQVEAETRGRTEGWTEGLAEGETKGRTEGLAEGLAEGEARGLAVALVSILEARGLALTDEDRQQILGCRDLARLRRWTRRVLGVDSVDDLWSD
jgi:hypothetical protein